MNTLTADERARIVFDRLEETKGASIVVIVDADSDPNAIHLKIAASGAAWVECAVPRESVLTVFKNSVTKQ